MNRASKINNVRPHLYVPLVKPEDVGMWSRWICVGQTVIGCGDTKEEAYARWKQKLGVHFVKAL